MDSDSVKSRFHRTAGSLKRLTGLDRAIAYTVLARCLNILGSAGTVLLIVHFLSPVQQGYYYALLSLVSLQIIFELGFSFVVQQLAAHESAHLQLLPDGRLAGAPAPLARLASTLQLTVRWYSRAAIALILLLLPLGWFFFHFHRHSSGVVAWHGPWTLVALASAFAFVLTPFYSFVDGCGQVRQVAGMRFVEAFAAVVMAWAAMLSGHGLYAPGMVILGQSAVGVIFLWRRRRMLFSLYRHPVGSDAVSWRNEVWPFQWKIAVSWMCAYFTSQVFVPMLFMLRGPVEAGQMGMSVSITGYISVLLLAWISTKATPFGRLIARGNLKELDRLFFATLLRSLVLLTLLAIACESFVIALQHIFPRMAIRMVPPLVFAVLLATMISGFVVQSLAIYLRSFKREPFLILYVTTALLSLATVSVTASRWGTLGVAVSYAFSMGTVGLISAVLIFRRFRREAVSWPTPLMQAEPTP